MRRLLWPWWRMFRHKHRPHTRVGTRYYECRCGWLFPILEPPSPATELTIETMRADFNRAYLELADENWRLRDQLGKDV